jgi:hypothetical protein
MKKVILACISALMTTSAFAKGEEIGCNVTEMFGSAMVQFSGAIERMDITQVDSGEPSASAAMMKQALGIEGTLSVRVQIEGNGSSYEATMPMPYAIKGDRIEAVQGQNIQKLSSYEDYTNTFGAFASVNCVAAN